MSDRLMALTPDLLARVHRVVADSGPLPGLVYHTEEDYDENEWTAVSRPRISPRTSLGQ